MKRGSTITTTTRRKKAFCVVTTKSRFVTIDPAAIKTYLTKIGIEYDGAELEQFCKNGRAGDSLDTPKYLINIFIPSGETNE